MRQFLLPSRRINPFITFLEQCAYILPIGTETNGCTLHGYVGCKELAQENVTAKHQNTSVCGTEVLCVVWYSAVTKTEVCVLCSVCVCVCGYLRKETVQTYAKTNIKSGQ